jgi:hypothetical protein
VQGVSTIIDLHLKKTFAFLEHKESERNNLHHPKFNTGAVEVGSHISGTSLEHTNQVR